MRGSMGSRLSAELRSSPHVQSAGLGPGCASMFGSLACEIAANGDPSPEWNNSLILQRNMAECRGHFSRDG
jgi:hypothetical protein